MKILIIGAGGREHALAWKIKQSDKQPQVWVTPGNGGTQNLSGDSYLEIAKNLQPDLTVVGPEIPLADGMVDQFQAQGFKIWGPSKAAAQIEASKAFAKAFMERHHIPTATSKTFTEFEAALTYLKAQTEPLVIKASGLAAGKGVILPETLAEGETALRNIMLNKQFGTAGDELLIEERLTGPEVSVFAFSDGKNFVLMPPAQDHKRAFDNDAGPNTGGMGAYAPTPVCSPDLLAELGETVIKPTLDGLRADGIPYVGVLYAGFMLTPTGPKILEFNCRFGDPETQVLLPLLETDLVDILQHSITGTLADCDVTWKEGAAATVVLASGGYPAKYETGKHISGIEEAEQLDGVTVFHAGTKQTDEGHLVTNGGRVLNVTGIGGDFREALQHAYAGVKQIQFEAMHYRTDIGAKALSS